MPARAHAIKIKIVARTTRGCRAAFFTVDLVLRAALRGRELRFEGLFVLFGVV